VVKNASAFNQFRSVVGDEANVIGRNALFSEAYDKTVKNGTLNPNALRAFITRKGAVIDEIPGLREEFNLALLDDQALKVHRSTLDDNLKVAEKRLADNFIAQSVDPQTGQALPGYNQIVNNMLQNRANLVRVKAQLADVDPVTSKAVKNALKAEFVNKAREFPDGGVAFLTDIKNKDVVEFLYGMKTAEGKQIPGLTYNSFRKSVEDILRLSDAAQKADISRTNIQLSQRELDSVGKALENFGLPGLDFPFLASNYRDRISSLFQKGVRILSRVNEARTKDATSAAYDELLFDPNGMKKLQSMANDINFNFKNPASVKRFVDTMTDVFPRYMYGTLITGSDEPVTVTPEEMVFGGFE
jgi:regulator of sigma D